MSAQKQPARVPFRHGDLSASYNAAAVMAEFGRLERALAPFQMRTVTADVIASVLDDVILADAAAGALTVALPDPTRVQWMAVTIKRINAGVNVVTIGGTVDGALNPALASQYTLMRVKSDGVAWWRIDG